MNLIINELQLSNKDVYNFIIQVFNFLVEWTNNMISFLILAIIIQEVLSKKIGSKGLDKIEKLVNFLNDKDQSVFTEQRYLSFFLWIEGKKSNKKISSNIVI